MTAAGAAPGQRSGGGGRCRTRLRPLGRTGSGAGQERQLQGGHERAPPQPPAVKRRQVVLSDREEDLNCTRRRPPRRRHRNCMVA